MRINSAIKDRFFYLLFTLVFITLPFPRYSLNSKFIILLGCSWLFYSPLKEKIILLRKNSNKFFLTSILFIIILIGLFYSNNLQNGFFIIGLQFRFVL
jgi:hypothetical protein